MCEIFFRRLILFTGFFKEKELTEARIRWFYLGFLVASLTPLSIILPNYYPHNLLTIVFAITTLWGGYLLAPIGLEVYSSYAYEKPLKNQTELNFYIAGLAFTVIGMGYATFLCFVLLIFA